MKEPTIFFIDFDHRVKIAGIEACTIGLFNSKEDAEKFIKETWPDQTQPSYTVKEVPDPL